MLRTIGAAAIAAVLVMAAPAIAGDRDRIADEPRYVRARDGARGLFLRPGGV